MLTYRFNTSPRRTLVREQYPSIHGHRYFVDGSMRVFFKSQSRVPGRLFSRAIRSEAWERRVPVLVEGCRAEQPKSASKAPAQVTSLSISRRLPRPRGLVGEGMATKCPARGALES